MICLLLIIGSRGRKANLGQDFFRPKLVFEILLTLGLTLAYCQEPVTLNSRALKENAIIVQAESTYFIVKFIFCLVWGFFRRNNE